MGIYFPMNEKFWYWPVSSAMPFETSSMISRLRSLTYSYGKTVGQSHLDYPTGIEIERGFWPYLSEKENESSLGDCVVEVVEATRMSCRLQSLPCEIHKFLGIPLEEWVDFGAC